MAQIADVSSPRPPAPEDPQEEPENVQPAGSAPEAAPQQEELETATLAEDTEPQDVEEKDTVDDSAAAQTDQVPRPGDTAPQPAPPVTATDDNQHPPNYPMAGYGAGHPRVGVETSGQQLPLTINQLAIVASSQNKLPVSKVKGIVLRLGRHTESSSKKSRKWYKDEHYVDKNSYSWKNMPLFDDHQRHLWTPEGTVRDSCKK